MHSFTITGSESAALREMDSSLKLGHGGLVRCDFSGKTINNNNNGGDDDDGSFFSVFPGDDDCNNFFSQWNRFPRSHKIGSGTFGKVFLCHDMLSTSPWYRHPVAVKVISMEALSDNEVAFAMNEVAILRHLQHKNIIQYIDSFIDREKQLCLVSEYMEGGDLAGMIRRNAESGDGQTTVWNSFQSHCLEEEKRKKHGSNDALNNKNTTITGAHGWIESYRIVDIVRQCLEALSYLHSGFIIHRDIKPANVYMTKNGVVKLGDFGVSKLVELTDPMAATFIGTPFYLSPELCLGEKYSFGVDIWALGVIAYEMYCLKLPFSADNVLAQIYVVTEGQYDKEALYQSHTFNSFQLQTLETTYGSDFSRQEKTLHRLIVELVQQMLVLDPLERPSAAQLLREFFFGDPSRCPSSAASVALSMELHAVDEGSPTKRVAALHDQTDPLSAFSAEGSEGAAAALFANCVNVSYEALVDMLPPERQKHVLRAASRPGSSAASVGGHKRLSLSAGGHQVNMDVTIRSDAEQVITETIERIPWLRDAKAFSLVSLQEGYNDDVVRVDWIDDDCFSLVSSQKRHCRSFSPFSMHNTDKNTALLKPAPDKKETERNVTAGADCDAIEAKAVSGTLMSSLLASKKAPKKADLLLVAAHRDSKIDTQQSDVHYHHHERTGKEDYQDQKEEEEKQQLQQQQPVVVGRCQGLPTKTLEALLRAKIMASCLRKQRKLKEIRKAHEEREKEKAQMREELNKLYAKSFYEKRRHMITRKEVNADETIGSPAAFAATMQPHSGTVTSFLPAAEVGSQLGGEGSENTFVFEQQSLNFFGSLADTATLRRTMDHTYLTNEVTRIAKDAADVADRCAMWTLKPPARLDFTKMGASDELDRCSNSPSVGDEQRGVNFDVYDTPVTLCVVWHESQVPACQPLSPSPSPSPPVFKNNAGSLVLPLSLTLKRINRHTRLGGVVWRVKETLKTCGLSHALLFPLDIDDAEEVGAQELGLRYVDRSGDVIAIAEASEWTYVKRDWWKRNDFTCLQLYMVCC